MGPRQRRGIGRLSEGWVWGYGYGEEDGFAGTMQKMGGSNFLCWWLDCNVADVVVCTCASTFSIEDNVFSLFI